MFRCGMVPVINKQTRVTPVINKQTRVTRYTATVIDHLFTNQILLYKHKISYQKGRYFSSFSNTFCC